jgi:hypothetical protein
MLSLSKREDDGHPIAAAVTDNRPRPCGIRMIFDVPTRIRTANFLLGRETATLFPDRDSRCSGFDNAGT